MFEVSCDTTLNCSLIILATNVATASMSMSAAGPEYMLVSYNFSLRLRSSELIAQISFRISLID